MLRKYSRNRKFLLIPVSLSPSLFTRGVFLLASGVAALRVSSFVQQDALIV